MTLTRTRNTGTKQRGSFMLDILNLKNVPDKQDQVTNSLKYRSGTQRSKLDT